MLNLSSLGLLETLAHSCKGMFVWLPVVEQLTFSTQTVRLSGKCQYCDQQFVEHVCPGTGERQLLPVVRQAPPAWFPILQATVRSACPACGLVMDLADTVANDPAATAQERQIAAEFKKSAVTVGAIGLALTALSWVTRDGTA